MSAFKDIFADLSKSLKDIIDGRYRKVYDDDGRTFRLVHEKDLPVEASLSCASTTHRDACRALKDLTDEVNTSCSTDIVQELKAIRSHSKRSKKASARSKMLKLIMPELSRDQGDELAKAISGKDRERVKEILSTIGDNIAKKL